MFSTSGPAPIETGIKYWDATTSQLYGSPGTGTAARCRSTWSTLEAVCAAAVPCSVVLLAAGQQNQGGGSCKEHGACCYRHRAQRCGKGRRLGGDQEQQRRPPDPAAAKLLPRP